MSENKDKKEKFEHQTRETQESLADLLSSLADGFRQGQFNIRLNDQQVSLSPKTPINLEIGYKIKKSNSKLKLEICWEDTPSAQIELG